MQQEPKEIRCSECGYLTKHTEHIGCLRKTLKAINDFEQRNFAIVDMYKASQPAQQEPVALETVYETIIHWDEGGGKRSRRELARRIVALYKGENT